MKKLFIHFCLIISYFSIYPTLSFAQSEVTASSAAEDSAVIIMYHRFGEKTFPTTNVTLDQIDQHIAELSKDIYNIVPLRTITEALKNEKKLPPRTIAITIDDGYLSIYQQAWPRFKAANIPFTLFISTASVNDQNKLSMTWDQIRELASDPLVDIGHHGHVHGHMTQMSTPDALADIELADETYRRELGYVPDIFAYPYGEYSDELAETLAPKNYHAALGQYSSAASSARDVMTLPRFAFNQNYADLDRFKLIINSRALPIKDILPRSANLENNPPAVGFTVNEDINGLSNIGCFPSHMSEAAKVTRIGENRIEIRFDQPFPAGRHRINCTMPGPDNRWYWFGMPFFNLGD
ncbi:MAG: polysaccharide deacetylase family protein [Kordiimonadaceae bacterium]|nr:polysaccharide deacetylase family protein [Kordiimonadaceae bacterium]MBT6036654.1 polysaccharide deacetylase family protein [Kordiimonadaceae bacterium]MBT6329252.1 polysaccharide deacetylase family protein [Kordiimonadaceae bacterium]